MATTALTLYSIEEHLAALLDTVDLVDDAEQQDAIAIDIQQALIAAVEKRDRVGQFLAHVEAQAAFADAEIKRLGTLKKGYQRAAERVESYVLQTINALGRDDKGKLKKLEGRTTVFSARPNPPSLEVVDEEAVPSVFKSVTVTVPAPAWEALIDAVHADDRKIFLATVIKAECAIDKTGLKNALKGGEIDGAKIADTKYRLVRS